MMRHKPNVLVILGWKDPVLIRAIGRYARKAGWHLESRSFFNELIPHGWRGDGMIVLRGTRPDMLRFIQKQASQQPAVILGSNIPGIEAPLVASDDNAAGRLAAEHLLGLGHKHFVWFSPFVGPRVTKRRRGFTERLREASQECWALERRLPDWRQRRRWLTAQLRRLPRPLAVFALDDQVAVEVVEVCVEQGWQVPEEVAVMGHGNMEVACECSYVPITSVDTGEEEVAWEAAALLDRMMRGERAPKEPIILQPKGVVQRRSTGSLVLTDPRLTSAVRYMREHLDGAIGLKHVATTIGISRRLMHELFFRELHTTPARFLLRLRLEQACQQLVETDDAISAIAQACGLVPLRNMNRCFQRELGCSPRAYRKERRQPV